MDGVAADGGAALEAAVFLSLLLLALLAVLAGAESFVDIARFGDRKLDLLRRFRPFRVEEAIVTIDAMGCQRDIAQRIVDKKITSSR